MAEVPLDVAAGERGAWLACEPADGAGVQRLGARSMVGVLPPGGHPVGVVLELPGIEALAAAAGRELRARALFDRDRCCGYFPALDGVPGIVSDLPSCREFALWLPAITHASVGYSFNFLRHSLVQQSADPAYHLDSDAATALTGDVTTLGLRRVRRLLLNLSTRAERTLHYLDVDPRSVELVVDGSYVRVADPGRLLDRTRTATIPRRRGTLVHGLVFIANGVLHSGVDDVRGHFLAAYGAEHDCPTPTVPPNAPSTTSRNSR
jgi:hypothetical protein